MSKNSNDNAGVSRKEFFRDALRGAASIFFTLFEDTLDSVEKAFPDIIRPPGSLPESEFVKACTRCGDCWRACPFFVIRPVIRPGSFDEGTPQILPWQAWCRMCPELPCIGSCPTGALRKIATPLRLGLAEIRQKACIRPKGTPCEACHAACPTRFSAITLGAPLEPPRIIADRCCGCGACAVACPASQPRAIWINST